MLMMRLRLAVLVALSVVATMLATAAVAQVPQTIVIDGVNDFDPSNLLDADGGDTQIQNWCTSDPEDDAPMDLGNIYITNDTNNLYIGFEYDRDCFASPQVNLGIAFSYDLDSDGGTTDPFNRKIAWNTITRKPDNVFYAVLDGFNYEVLYEWSGTAWTNISTSVNPGWGGGSDGFGMANDLGFEELALPLNAFVANGGDGLQVGETVHIEIWMTQDGTSKPPLDAMGSDDVQTSTPTSTIFDTGTAVEMTTFIPYVIQNAVDNDAPQITSVRKNPQVDSEVLVVFNEPVDQVTAETPANYAVTGHTVVSATRGIATNTVTLGLASSVFADNGAYTLTINGVQDLAGNAIVGGSYDFAVKEVVFRGKFQNYLNNNGTGSDAFTVEGSKEPLDFNLVADPISSMTQVDPVNEIWEAPVLFSWGIGPTGNPQNSTFTIEWKFNHNLLNWETIGNRVLVLDAADPASQVTEHFWDDLDPSQFTTHDIDVIFTVDMSAVGPVGGDTVEIAGDVAPLSFSAPFVAMADDGLGQDAVAGDDIYTVVVTFPAGSLKNVGYKYVFNAGFECFGAGNRNVFLNDALFDTVGGALGPIVMPLQTYDRCNVIAGDVEVIFSVDLDGSIYEASGITPTVGLAGSVAPLVFDPITSAVPMLDDGVAPDAVAGDLIYTVSVVFPDSSNTNLDYKYVVEGEFEGTSMPNRFVYIDDTHDAVGNPQVLPTDRIHQTIPVGVTPRAGRALSIVATPNPFNPQTMIEFVAPRSGKGRLDIFDTRGRHVRTLLAGDVEAGPNARIWDGRADDGRGVASGVYFARVSVDGAAAATKLMLVK